MLGISTTTPTSVAIDISRLTIPSSDSGRTISISAVSVLIGTNTAAAIRNAITATGWTTAHPPAAPCLSPDTRSFGASALGPAGSTAASAPIGSGADGIGVAAYSTSSPVSTSTSGAAANGADAIGRTGAGAGWNDTPGVGPPWNAGAGAGWNGAGATG